MKQFKLVSSNKNKLKEFRRILPQIEAVQGLDLREVLADKDTVILYKVKELNKNYHIVEDTILEIYNTQTELWEEVVDIKYKLKTLEAQTKARWITSLAFSDGKYIFVYQSSTKGSIDSQRPLKGFGFDNIFFPDNCNKSLYELENQKDQYSPRFKALIKLKNNDFSFKKRLKSLPTWTGEYQS